MKRNRQAASVAEFARVVAGDFPSQGHQCFAICLVKRFAVHLPDEIGTNLVGVSDGLVAAEPVDLAVVAAGQHLGYAHAAPDSRFGVLVMFQKRIRACVGFLSDGIGVAHESGNQARNGLKHHGNGNLAAVKHIVADGILAYVHTLRAVIAGDTGIVTLIAPAAEQEMTGVG